ncbi:SRPBCC family protein [Mycolicibacterium baixiangningiae]|uniref:hypothetical protein n=1 Tax=Mycolicibacterium baixiangningiae TaxID=2761578 RepID=UPI00186789D9|nr:hypothetical protein [Mycolicibacterium baixiangningiae]
MLGNNLRSADDFLPAITVYEENISLISGVDEVWTELAAGNHRFLPGINVEWLTVEPHGVGTLRIMNFGPVHLRSRYFAWDETNHYKAFYLENPPVGVRELVEHFRVTPNGSGSIFSYRLAVIPTSVIRPLIPALSAYVTFVMRNWHVRFIKRRFGASEARHQMDIAPAQTRSSVSRHGKWRRSHDS